jgi:DNA polymerase V
MQIIQYDRNHGYIDKNIVSAVPVKRSCRIAGSSIQHDELRQDYKTALTGVFAFKVSARQACPMFLTRAAAGFPSPADDYIEQNLDLNEFLIKHPSATFFVRVAGESMIGAGINDGDILIVDRALDARDGSIIIAVLDGEFTVKRLVKHDNKVCLVPENPKFRAIEITEGRDFDIWGVVTNVIHPV